MNTPAPFDHTLSPSVLVLTRSDVRRLLTIEACIAAVEQAFRMHGEAATPAPGVLGTQIGDGEFHIKAGVLPFEGGLYYAAKANANFPDNRARFGLPTIQGAVLLFDAECGRPLAIMDSIELTALRTAAATAVAAKHLARADAGRLAVVGCGTQAPFQILALSAVLPIAATLVYDTDVTRAQALAAEMRARLGSSIEAVVTLEEATRQSHLIVTCTPSRTPFLSPLHVRPGTLIAAVGADSEAKQELDPQLLARNRVIPDVIAQAARIGELHHALEAQVLDLRSVNTDLGQVVAGRHPGRTAEDEIIVFDSTGMALQDVAAACAVYKNAIAEGAVRRVPLSC